MLKHLELRRFNHLKQWTYIEKLQEDSSIEDHLSFDDFSDLANIVDLFWAVLFLFIS